MSVDVKIIYAMNRTSITFKNVPTSSNIRSIKKNIQTINKMDSISPIRIVYKGIILDDDFSIQKIISDEQNELTLYAAGIPNLQPPKSNEKAKVPQINLNKESIPFKILKFIFYFLGLLFIFLTPFFFVYRSFYVLTPTDSDISSELKISVNQAYLGVLFTTLILEIFICILIRKINFRSLFRGLCLFVNTILPTFNVAEFKQKHGIN